MALQGVKGGSSLAAKPKRSPKKPPPAVPTRGISVAHAQRGALAQAQAEVIRQAQAKPKPSRVKPLLGPFKDGSQHYLDTKTGTTYLQRKTASNGQVRRAVIQLFQGTAAEKAKGRRQLERYGVLGGNPAPAYGIKEIPHAVTAPTGLARQERAQQARLGTKGPAVFKLGAKQGTMTQAGAFKPEIPEPPRGIGKILQKGVFGGGGKALGALGEVFHVTGTGGRLAADALHLHGGGLAGAARLGLEIALDPTTYLTAGAGAELKGAARAAAAARDLEAAGVSLHEVEGAAALAHEAARSGDARPLAKALEDAKVHNPHGQTPSQKIAGQSTARGQRAATKGTAYLPHQEGQAAVTQRTLRAVKTMRRPGIHVGIASPTGARRIGKINLEPATAHLRIPVPVLKRTLRPVAAKGTKDFINVSRGAQIRAQLVAKHAPGIDAVTRDLKAAEDLGPGAAKNVDALRGQLADLTRTRDTEIAHAVSAQERAPIRMERGNERMYRRNLANISHTANLGAAELGRVTRANLERGLHDAIAPVVKEHGQGAELTNALEKVQLYHRANEAGGSAARDVLTKLDPLSAGEQKAYDNLTTLYAQMRRQGKAHGFLKDVVENFGGKRIATGRSADEPINEMLASAQRTGAGSVARHRTMPSAFDIASPTRTAADIQRVMRVTPEQAQRAAEELYQRGSTHFHAEQVAHQVQRGILPVHVDELHPQQIKAIAHWGKYQHFHGEPALFRDIADPAAEGHVLLNPHDKFEHFAPGTLSDAQKRDQLAADLHKATQMHDAALAGGDAKQAASFAHVQERLRSEQAALQVPHSAGQPVAVDAHSVAHVGANGHEPLYRRLPRRKVEIFDERASLKSIERHHRKNFSYDPSVQGIDAKTWYHGTNAEIPSAGALDATRTNITNLFGQGVYLTDDPKIAGDYAKNRAEAAGRNVYRKGEPKQYVYAAKVHLNKVLDMQAPADPEFIRTLARQLRSIHPASGRDYVDAFNVARHEREASHGALTNADAYRAFQHGLAEASHDYPGLAHEVGFELNMALRDQGYDALTHMGGVATHSGHQHQVLVLLDPNGVGETVGHVNPVTEFGVRQPPALGSPSEIQSGRVVILKRLKAQEPRPEVHRYGQQEFEAGPHEDPLDIRNTGDLSFVLDPREVNYFHANAQARLVTATTRWRAVDHAFGRPSHVVQQVENADGELVDKLVANPDLIKRGPDLWYDPKLNQEYMVPKIGQQPITDAIGEHQLWPTQVVASMTHELLTTGEFNQIYESAAGALYGRTMSQIRMGVTVPFPAYHLRNLATDALMSLQADSGVMFHPIVNTKLALAAFRAGKGAEMVVPGIGKMSLEDFTFFADAMGIRSGQHLADYAMTVGDKPTAGRLRAWAQRAKHGAIAAGSHREDVVRYQTFVQRLRRNGGDAADAAWHMIQHHFDYNDLSLFEKRFMRNVFLFYTWYRKNIPLQFSELFRRPGFFAAVGHTYEALAQGQSPVNVNWSKLNPMLPDMSGALPHVQGLPSYVTDSLVAPGVNWNGHAAYFGFGAPWADMQLMSGAGLQQWISMLSPAINYPTALIFKKDPLTGRDLMANEPSGQANALDWIAHKLGFGPLKRDSKGRPVLPLALDLFLRDVPIFGRGGGAFTPTSAARDQGRLSTLGHALGSTVFGVNPIVFPKKGTKGASLNRHNAIIGLLSDRARYHDERVNLPKDELDKEMRDYDLHVMLPAAHAQGITTYELRKAKGFSAGSSSTIYKKKGRGGAASNFGIAGSGSSAGKNYGISGAGTKTKNFGVSP